MSKVLAEVKRLSKMIDGQIILDNISIKVHEKEILVIIGPNGSGKTTLLRCLNLLTKGTGGEICYAFENITASLKYTSEKKAQIDKKEKELTLLKRNMHLLFQKPVVFSGSVLDNCLICGPLRGVKYTKKQALDALDRVGIASLWRQSAHTLSGGETTRLALARAWLIQPSLLLLDEPSANLDPKGTKLFEDLIISMVHDFSTSVVMVTQDLFQAKRIADQVGFLLHGNILEIQDNPSFFDQPQHPQTQQFLSGQIVI